TEPEKSTARRRRSGIARRVVFIGGSIEKQGKMVGLRLGGRALLLHCEKLMRRVDIFLKHR
ncbi:MAG: hypothetical protein D3909_00800, partial [Candidatus Electrothrix sp. ATG1]|nr:hypothetical protein [Candidatus Electrothrix sp. ATG1]